MRRSRLARVLDVVLIIALLLIVVLALTLVQRARRHLATAQEAMGQLQDTLIGGSAGLVQLLQDPKQVGAFQDTLTKLDTELIALERLARPLLPLSPYLGWLPGIGGDVEAAPHLLTMARQTSEAARTLTDGLLPMVAGLSQTEGSVGSLGPDLVHGLTQTLPQIEHAQQALAEATNARAQVDVSRLSSRTRTWVQRFDRYQPTFEKSLQALTLLPGLLGADGPRAYLVLAQNNHELRATGGFISGVGLARVDKGRITELDLRDSYTVDDLTQPHPLPPEPLRRQMGTGMLLLRDANWWPDFPYSAQVAADLYRQDQGHAVDGVLAVDLTVLKLLLQAVGPIQVPGYDQPVSSENLERMIMSYWQAPLLTAPGKGGTDWWLHRKDLAADLMSSLLTYLTEQATIDDLGELAQATSRALRERHLLLYVKDERAQPYLHEAGWDGALVSPEGDYLMVVDTNVGFNKVNPNVEQTVDYQVEFDKEGSPTARLSLSYQHRIQRPMPACLHESYYGDEYADLMERCYWDHLRIYLPAGSELIEVLGADEPAKVYDESGRTVIATSFLLANDQARQIQFIFRPNLPSTSGQYTLFVQKQPGTDALPLRVTIIPPDGARPNSVATEGLIWSEGRAVWQGDLAQDRVFEFSWD